MNWIQLIAGLCLVGSGIAIGYNIWGARMHSAIRLCNSMLLAEQELRSIVEEIERNNR